MKINGFQISKFIGNASIAVFVCYALFLVFYVSKTSQNSRAAPSLLPTIDQDQFFNVDSQMNHENQNALINHNKISDKNQNAQHILPNDIPSLPSLHNHHTSECERIGGCKYRELATPFDLYQRTGENMFDYLENARFLTPQDDLTPRFISAVNKENFKEFLTNTANLRKHADNRKIRISVYDLGLTLLQQDEVKNDHVLELRTLPWSTFKAHVEQDFKNNAWKLCILADALKYHPVVAWFASNIEFKHNLKKMVEIFNEKREDSGTDVIIFTPDEDDEYSNAYGTHQHMFEY